MQHIHEVKKGKGAIQANDQPEILKHLYSPQIFQNGNSEECQRPSPRGVYAVNLAKESRKFVRFQWEGNLYEYTSLVFGLGWSAPKIFTKILKVPVTLLRKLKIRLVIYIDEKLILARSQNKIEVARDTTLYLLQNLGFLINWEKSVLTRSKTMEFPGIKIDSEEMTFSIPNQKIKELVSLRQKTTQTTYISLRNLASIIGKLRATAPAFLPAPIQVRYLQNLLRENLKSKSYESQIPLSTEAQLELKWWKEKLSIHDAHGKSLKSNARKWP